MSAAIELESTLKANNARDVASRYGSVQFFERHVQVGDISVVVFGVVNLHGFCGNDGYEGKIKCM